MVDDRPPGANPLERTPATIFFGRGRHHAAIPTSRRTSFNSWEKVSQDSGKPSDPVATFKVGIRSRRERD